MPFAFAIKKAFATLTLQGGHAIKLYLTWLLLMMSLHIGAMMILEDMTFLDAIWITFVTATTVGYGDVSAKTAAGRIATIVLMFVGTIFVLATLASLVFERAAERRARKDAGKWRWNLRDHLLIISTTGNEPVRYLKSLITQVRTDEAYADRAVMIMTHGFDETGGLPDALKQLNVTFVSGDGDTDDELKIANACSAQTIIVLGDDSLGKADAYVFDVVTRLRSFGYNGRIIAECVDDNNRKRLCTQSGDSSIRPVRGYPEMLARAVVAAGAEQVIEELFTSGNAECELIPVRFDGPWKEVCRDFLDHNIGMPIGYRSKGEVVTAPAPSTFVRADGIYAVLPQGKNPEIMAKLQALAFDSLEYRPA